jgi:glutathione reductase (NADPH)
MPEFDVDLFVIGAGSGGVRAARIAASHGAKVMIAEEFRVGGTCVIRGCIPKKLMVYASRFLDDFEDAAGFGWTVPQPLFDWNKLVASKEGEISRLSAIYRTNLEKAGVAIVESRAEVVDPNRIRFVADGREITARYILVSTGGTPALEPPIPGLEYTISSNEVFDLPSLPKRMLIVGGGYIAVEFASVFTRLGTAVTLVVRSENVLRGFDEDMRCSVQDALRHAGVELKTVTLPTKIEKTSSGLSVTLSDGSVMETDYVMLATGRHPHTKGLGLEKAGVKLDAVGAVVVDHFSKTNVDSIYAVGDVTNRVALTPVAIREGQAVAENLFAGQKIMVDYANIATAVFTTPELGTVGLTEHQAREQFDCVDVYAASFRPLKATLSGRQEKTSMKIVVDGLTDRVLGVHIFGEAAGEMAQLLGIAVKLGAKKADFDATMAVHPTSAEELVTMRTRTARYERETIGEEGPGAAVSAE